MGGRARSLCRVVLAVAHGRRTLETMAIVAPHLATPEEAARLDALEAREESNEAAIAGAKALLEALPVDRWAVVTSAGHELALARLDQSVTASAASWLERTMSRQGKPAPDGYLKAAAGLGVAPERCMVIEDTPAGAMAGRAAGATVIGLRTTFGPSSRVTSWSTT